MSKFKTSNKTRQIFGAESTRPKRLWASALELQETVLCFTVVLKALSK